MFTFGLGILQGMKRLLLTFILLLLLVACTPTTEAPASKSAAEADMIIPATETIPPPIVTVDTPRVESPTATSAGSVQAVPTPEPAADEPTAAPVEEVVVTESGVVSGRTPEGAFFLGDPNAPITHIDYSDFL